MSKYKIVKVLKGGSFSSTNVIQDEYGNKRVRKFISHREDREYGLVRWHSQIRRMQYLNTILPENTPNIIEMGATETHFFYDIKFYEGSQNLFEYLSKQENSDIFSEVSRLIDIYTDTKFGYVKGSFSVFFVEEVLDKLEMASGLIKLQHDSAIFSEDEFKYMDNNLKNALKRSVNILEVLKKININETFTHGNLTLENMIFDENSKKIILIDPYSETYCENVLGDYSQLMQSSISNYEIINNLGESYINNIQEINAPQIPQGINSFGMSLKAMLENLNEEEKLILQLFHAGQFIRMYPFKANKTPRLAAYFLMHGINLILETENGP